MDVTEILQFADQLVFDKTEKHLDDLQKTVIKGVYEGKTYDTIAEECHRSESRVRSAGRRLWKILSESLGDDINKHNFCWTLERLANSFNESNLSNSSQQVLGLINSHINLCNNNQPQNHSNNINKNDFKEVYHDLTLAPQIIKFYNRETELQNLSNWICRSERPFAPTRLISILGLSGIGKSYLVRKFVDLNLDQFEVIIWKSLKFPKPLDLLINDLLNY